MRSLALVSMLYLASCSKTPPQEPVPPAAPAPDLAARAGGKWVEEFAKSDDSIAASITVTAEAPYETATGAKVFPKLTVSCTTNPVVVGGIFMVGIMTGFPAEIKIGKDESETADVVLQYDAKPPESARWFSTEDKLTLMNMGSEGLVVDIGQSETMLIQFKPLKSKPVVAKFDTRGLKAHLKLLLPCSRNKK